MNVNEQTSTSASTPNVISLEQLRKARALIRKETDEHPAAFHVSPAFMTYLKATFVMDTDIKTGALSSQGIPLIENELLTGFNYVPVDKNGQPMVKHYSYKRIKWDDENENNKS